MDAERSGYQARRRSAAFAAAKLGCVFWFQLHDAGKAVLGQSHGVRCIVLLRGIVFCNNGQWTTVGCCQGRMWHSATGLRINALQSAVDIAMRSDPDAHTMAHDMQRTGEVALSDRDMQLFLILATDRNEFPTGLCKSSDQSIQILPNHTAASTGTKFQASDLFLALGELQAERFQISLRDAQRTAVMITICGLLAKFFLSQPLLQVGILRRNFCVRQ